MNEFIKQQMSVEESGISAPSLELMRDARARVLKKQSGQPKGDVFFLTAMFLNLHVKLSYAVMLTLCFGLASFYFIKRNGESNENISSPYEVNIVSARSGTVLSSIVTFESRH